MISRNLLFLSLWEREITEYARIGFITVDYYFRKFLTEVQYSVETMTMTHWCILGIMSVVVGMLYLRGSNNRG